MSDWIESIFDQFNVGTDWKSKKEQLSDIDISEKNDTNIKDEVIDINNKESEEEPILIEINTSTPIYTAYDEFKIVCQFINHCTDYELYDIYHMVINERRKREKNSKK